LEEVKDLGICMFSQFQKLQWQCFTWVFTFVFVYGIHSYLVTVMGLVIPWSITLLVVDAYSVFIKCLPLQRRLVMIVFLGDMVCAICDLKNLKSLLFPCHANALMILQFFYTPDFVISVISCCMFNSQCHRSPARCRSILLPSKAMR